VKRPFGVSVLALFFVGLATFGLYLGVVGFIADVDDPLHLAGGLFFVVIAFMSAALGMGLWNLEEDARRAAIAFFGLPSAFGLVGGVVTAFYEKPPESDLVWGVTCLFVIGLPALYLMRPRTKATFDQLVTIRLLD
jgi:hypothetical protein